MGLLACKEIGGVRVMDSTGVLLEVKILFKRIWL